MDFMDSPGSSPLCRLLLGAIRSAQGTSLGDLHASNAPSLSGLQYKQMHSQHFFFPSLEGVVAPDLSHWNLLYKVRGGQTRVPGSISGPLSFFYSGPLNLKKLN